MIRFSLKDFWIGVQINKSVRSFTDVYEVALNILPCVQISFTYECAHKIRDYGQIVERSFDVSKRPEKKYEVVVDAEGYPIVRARK